MTDDERQVAHELAEAVSAQFPTVNSLILECLQEIYALKVKNDKLAGLLEEAIVEIPWTHRSRGGLRQRIQAALQERKAP